MSQLFECVPDYSEGRDKAKIDAITAEIRAVPGVTLLDVQMDANHNRSVVTFVGDGDAVTEAAFRSARKAMELIDLNHHKGEHPRMGATDVCPFIPLKNATMKDAVALAKKTGRRIGDELKIPVYLYAEAAEREDRRNLPDVRKGEFEGLREIIGQDPGKTPDFGPNRIHATAGATAVGAREFLVAYNINLDTRDLSVAKAIAKNIREKSGGFKAVRALGFDLADRGLTQVSMNMVNVKITGLQPVFDAVARQARDKNVSVVESEIVGLTPVDALVDAACAHLKLKDFSKSQILENRLSEAGVAGAYQAEADIYRSFQPFMDQLSSAAPVPGGGTVAALAGALAGALSVMVCNLTVGKKKYKEVEAEAAELRKQASALRDELKVLAKKDAEAFARVAEAMTMARETEAEKFARKRAMEHATLGAIEVPLTVMAKCADVLAIAERVAEIGNPNAASDAGVAALMALAGARGAELNVRINLPGLSDEAQKNSFTARAADLMRRAQALETATLAKVASKIQP